MITQEQLAALLIKIAVAASIASVLMRFARFQKILFRDERTIDDRIQLAFVFAAVFGGSAFVRSLTRQYGAIDLAMEGAMISGFLGGYVSGLITGLFVSLPDMFDSKLMSMPLFAAAGILGGVMHDLAPKRDDVWAFSPFVDLNLYRILKQVFRRNRAAIDTRVAKLAAFNLVCNAIVILVELLRWGVHSEFQRHNTFLMFEGVAPTAGLIVFSAIATLFAVSLPVRVWSSFRAERQLETQKARLVEARLEALTNQINPHFLFNTLNSISTLIRIDPDRARSMIYRLSKIMRRLLRKTDNLSPLREEISFIDDYMGIELVRFGDKLRFVKEVDARTLDRVIPSMILQPIIENSIRHGLASKVNGGTIWLRTSLDGDRLTLVVADDGVGMSDEKIGAILHSGVGVSNVNERLRVLFGGDYRLEVSSTEGGGTKTTIEIPQASLESEQAELIRSER